MKIMKNYKVEATYDENFLLTAVVACEKPGDSFALAGFCQILMDHFGFGDYKITDMLMKARNCQFEDIKIALGSEISNCYDDVDLMRDEFKRIKVISKNKEIDGLCDRALARSKRITPVIDEINELKKQREHLEQWISAIADDHKQIPDWIQQSARSLLANSAT